MKFLIILLFIGLGTANTREIMPFADHFGNLAASDSTPDHPMAEPPHIGEKKNSGSRGSCILMSRCTSQWDCNMQSHCITYYPNVK